MLYVVIKRCIPKNEYFFRNTINLHLSVFSVTKQKVTSVLVSWSLAYIDFHILSASLMPANIDISQRNDLCRYWNDD